MNTVRRADDVLTTPMDDTLLMLNIRQGRYHGLNEVAARIWELLETPTSAASLVAALVGEFDIGEEDCARDVADFLARLRERGLLTDVA